MKFQEHGTQLPDFEQAQWKDGKALPPSPGKVRWSNAEPPPPVGARIRVLINSCGPAVVTGYFTQEGWLGLMCDLLDPPAWHVKQNKGNRRGHVFGAEIKIEGNDNAVH